jgi:hypothetical protein
VNETWTAIAVDESGTFVYGPRLGRLYLLPAEQTQDVRFQRIVGLAGPDYQPALPDPVERIVHDRTGLTADGIDDAPLILRGAYLLFLRARRYVPLRATARVVMRSAWLWRRCAAPLTSPSSSDIGRLVHLIEHRLGIADCYPRALTTAWLCLVAGRPCTLIVGVLAPTRKMHAWCEVDGELPYEPLPEHYLYQPLWTLALTP